jgi:hypothetical protein
VVRRANDKSVAEISADVRRAQSMPLAPGEQWLEPQGIAPPRWLLPLAFRAPQRLRRWLYWDRLLKNPWRVKKTLGTVVVTPVPLMTRSGSGGWGIPLAIHPLVVALGAVGRRPGFVEGRIEARDLLSLTVLFGLEVIDGVPMAPFLRRLTELMEGAFALQGDERSLPLRSSSGLARVADAAGHQCGGSGMSENRRALQRSAVSRSTSANSSSVSLQAVVAATLASTCSADIAPTITEAT